MPVKPIASRVFLSTLPARGATVVENTCTTPPLFLSTLPARGATQFWPSLYHRCLFLSTLPARGATSYSVNGPTSGQISIHAPREGSDCSGQKTSSPIRYFYPRSPRGERHANFPPMTSSNDFYPRSPRGERPFRFSSSCLGLAISIHAPREGSDWLAYVTACQDAQFLSTLPARGATKSQAVTETKLEISIHAPREGSDPHPLRRGQGGGCISIHAPREGSDDSFSSCFF